MLREDLAKNAVRVALGEKCEYLAVRVNSFKPSPVFNLMYGSTARPGTDTRRLL